MRIIAGKYKGRQLNASKNQSIRPTTNKIKEYVFSLLDDFVLNANIVDLFCGSGSLGIEALSRGAQNVTFVDNSQDSLRILRRNVNQIKVEEPYKVVRKDAVAFLKGNRQPFDLIFADPPDKWSDFEKALPMLFKSSNLGKYGIVVLENEKSQDINWDSEVFEVLRQKKFDRRLITFLSRKGAV